MGMAFKQTLWEKSTPAENTFANTMTTTMICLCNILAIIVPGILGNHFIGLIYKWICVRQKQGLGPKLALELAPGLAPGLVSL